VKLRSRTVCDEGVFNDARYTLISFNCSLTQEIRSMILALAAEKYRLNAKGLADVGSPTIVQPLFTPDCMTESSDRRLLIQDLRPAPSRSKTRRSESCRKRASDNQVYEKRLALLYRLLDRRVQSSFRLQNWKREQPRLGLVRPLHLASHPRSKRLQCARFQVVRPQFNYNQ